MEFNAKAQRRKGKNKMSHVFISYAHDDQDKYQVLDKFIAELKKVGFTDDDIWYDKNIDTGSRWHVEIDTALEESFAIVVLLAPAAMASPYVTYEWSWAIGNGAKPIPLLMYGSYDDPNFHLRLRDIHCVDCRKSIPTHVIEAIKDKKKTPPDADYLNRLIQRIVQPLRVHIRLLLWFYPLKESQEIDKEFFRALVFFTSQQLENAASSQLSELMVDKSHAFTSRQRRVCRKIVEQTEHIATFLSILDRAESYEQEVMEWLQDFFATQWLPTTDSLDGKHSIVEFLDDYLDGDEKDEANREELYEMFASLKSREEIDAMLDSENAKQETAAFAHHVITAAYSDKEQADNMWTIIEDIQENKSNTPNTDCASE